THHHSDHNADYGTLLLLEWGDNLTTSIDTWGPPPLVKMTKQFLEMSAPDISVRIRDEGRPPLAPLVRPHEIRRGGLVMKDDLGTVTCAVVPHPLIPIALAYRFDCPDRSIVISGDTAPSDALVTLATGADVLVHEALYVPAAPGAPGSPLRTHVMNSHTPVEEAGRVAARAGVRTLVLSHFVPSENPPVTDEQWLAGARTTFGGRIIVGRELLEVEGRRAPPPNRGNLPGQSKKRKPPAERDGACTTRRAGDLAERVAGRRAEPGTRVAPADRVGHVVGVDAELRVLRIADLEPLEQRAVELPEARAVGAAVTLHVALHSGRRQRVHR